MPSKNLKKASFVDYMYRFLEELKVVQYKSVHTIRCYAADLNNLKIFLEENTFEIPESSRAPRVHLKTQEAERGVEKDQIDLTMVGRQVVRSFLRHLNAEKASARTISRHISSLRSFFKFTVTQEAIAKNPMRHIKKPKLNDTVTTYLTYEQVEQLLDQPNTANYLGLRDRCMMELLYSSALRVSELINIDRKDIDFELLVILIQGKGERDRIVPITETAAKWLRTYLNHMERKPDNSIAQPVFHNRDGQRLTTRSVNRRFDIYLETVGLKGKVTPHTIRHTIATHWLENGMSINTIKTLLGHKSFSTTTIYTRVTEKLKKQAYDKAFSVGSAL
jgi:integrase/recombinase XerC